MNWKISAFADELGPDPEFQFSTLKRLGIGEIQLRGAWDKSVMKLSAAELAELRELANYHGLGFHAISSPLGKSNIADYEQKTLDGVKIAAAAAHAVGATRIRIFSFYRDSTQTPEEIRSNVINRLGLMLEEAKRAGVSLVHENESGIYGDTGVRCLDLSKSLDSLGQCFDFSNFVLCGEDALDCWNLLRDHVVYFDIKDAVASSRKIVPVGEGDGKLENIFRDALQSGYDDRFNLEPHLTSGGQFGGSTSPELFEIATNALRKVLTKASQ